MSRIAPYALVLFFSLFLPAHAQSLLDIQKCDSLEKFDAKDCRDKLQIKFKIKLKALDTKVSSVIKQVAPPEEANQLVQGFIKDEKLWQDFTQADCGVFAGSWGGSGEGDAEVACVLNRYNARLNFLEDFIKNPN